MKYAQGSSYIPNFMKVNEGAGRPPSENNFPLEIDNFVNGVDTYFDPMVPSGNCYIAINNDVEAGRTLDKAAGYEKAGSDSGSGKVLFMGSLNQMGGTDIFIRIVTSGTAVQVQKSTNGTTWSNLGSAFGNSSSQVNFYGVDTVIGGEERLYFTNGIDQLRYTEGTTISTVSDGATPIYGNFITAVENVLVLANLNTTHSNNEIVYAKAGTHQFRRDVDTDYASTSQKITFDGEITQIATLGWLVYIFTKSDGLWELDLNTGVPRVISTHSTIAPKSVAVGHGMMIWCDQYSFWALALGGQVMRLGESIENIYKNVSVSNLSEINAIVTPNGQYKAWVGDITFEGEDFDDVELVYDIEKSRIAGEKIWRIRTNKPSNYKANWTNSAGFENTYFGSPTNILTYLDDTGSDYDGSNIKLDWRSKDFILVNEKAMATLTEFYFKYRPDDTNDISFSLYMRSDMGDWELVKIVTLEANADKDMVIGKIEFDRAQRGRTIALRFVVDNQYDFRMYEAVAFYAKNSDNVRPL